VDDFAKLLILFGIAVTLSGALLLGFSRLTGGGGTLPGTLTFQTDNLTCLIPLGASLLLSIVLTVILNLLLQWLRK
jgi:Protein of unknown function (DUF2905)